VSSVPFAFDSRYINGLREKDPEVEAHFVDHFNPVLLRLLRGKVRCADQARELRQEVFLRVLTALRAGARVDKPEQFEGFVIAIGRNVAREAYRKQSRVVAFSMLEDEPAGNLPSAYSLVVAQQTRAHVRRVLSRLDAGERAALTSLLMDKENKDALCRQLGINRTYLRVLVFRAKRQFIRKHGCTLDHLTGHSRKICAVGG
jgi:DNA-directed RNA polymerase specialized sigma24 family protein